LKLWNRWNSQSRTSGARCLRSSLIAVSVNGDDVWNVLFRRMTGILNIFLNNFSLVDYTRHFCYSLCTFVNCITLLISCANSTFARLLLYVASPIVVQLHRVNVKSELFVTNRSYVCQKLLDTVKAFKRHGQKCALAAFFCSHGTSRYAVMCKIWLTALRQRLTVKSAVQTWCFQQHDIQHPWRCTWYPEVVVVLHCHLAVIYRRESLSERWRYLEPTKRRHSVCNSCIQVTALTIRLVFWTK